MKNFEEKVIESVMGQLNISRNDAENMAHDLMSGKIPFL